MRKLWSMTGFFLALLLLLMPALAQQGEKEISLEALIESRAAQLFQMENYEEALGEFEKLRQKFPQDPLLQRYVGMILALLGRLEEAASALEEATRLHPENPALHYFLARTYHEQGAREKAEKELKEVIRLDPQGFYGQPAEETLPKIRIRAPAPRRWNLFGSVGYEYDSNVTLEPNDKGRASLAGQNANRFFFSLGAEGTGVERGQFLSRLGYRANQSLHDDTLNEFNFTFQEFSLFNRLRTQLAHWEVDWGLRYAFPVGFLDGNLFSLANEITPSVHLRLTPNSRTEIYHRYSHFEFGPDGQTPRLTSRDGEYHTTGIFHTQYFSNFRRYLFVGYELEITGARGDNFDRRAHGFQTGFHTPFSGPWTLDFFGGFTLAHYPHFSAELVREEPPARQDQNWTFLVSLTYPLNRHWSLRSFYRYINANNQNDVFQYDRQIGGLELTFHY